jgi:hypothetical protein
MSNLKRPWQAAPQKEGTKMTNKPTAPNLQQPSLETIARRIRERCARMNELGADFVRLAMANGDDLAEGRPQFTKHGSWLSFLREACELRQRQALTDVTLAQHRPAVEAYLQHAANLGTKPSIRGALDFISPRGDRPKKPKKLVEIETPALLGAFLNDRRDLFWEALQLAPELKGEIAQRLSETASTAGEPSKPTAEAAAQMRAIRELLRHPTSTNIESARDKATRTVRLLDPEPAPKLATIVPSKAALDPGLLPKALALSEAA